MDITSVKENFSKINKSFKADVETLGALKSAKDITLVETGFKEVLEKYLGKQSEIQAVLKSINKIENPSDKREVGMIANKLTKEIEEKLDSLKKKLLEVILVEVEKEEVIDATRPGASNVAKIGHKHIITSTIERIEDIFTNLGFEVEYAYEIDSPENAFDHLNIPESHPARDNWDTLWVEGGNLAIPHTSSMQNRILKSETLPVKKVIISKCFRNEATDATHEHTFHQVEGVYMDTRASMAEMLGVLLEFFYAYYGKKLDHKFTPDFFPFVEPGGQLALEFIANTKDEFGKVIDKRSFIEILGCGIIHPNVISAAGKDPAKAKGFAWGFGVERVFMVKEKIEDIRLFYGGNLKFTKQFI